MSALILPRRLTSQPQGLVSLAPRFFEKSALCFLPNSLHLSNLARSNAGKVLTRVAPTLKTAHAGRGVACNGTTRAYLDADWIAPIQTSASDGTGAFSLLLSATMASAGARTFPFNIRLNSGVYTSVLIVQNGYYAPGGTSSIYESGTLWIGFFNGIIGATGFRLTGFLSATPREFTAVFQRYSDGASSIWADGALVSTDAVSSPTSLTNGTAQLLSIGGNSVADGFATPDPIHLLYAANDSFSDAESARLSRNPWQIFQPTARILPFAAVAGGGGSLAASATGAAVAGGGAQISAQVALGAVGVALAGGSANLGASVPLSATGISVSSGSANATATVTISAAGLAQAAGQAGLSAEVLLAAAGAAQASGNAVLAGQLSAQAAGAAQAGGSASLSVAVQLVATGAAQAGGAANLTGGPPGAVSASGAAQAAGSAIASVDVSLSAAGFVQAIGAGQLVVQVDLSATGGAIAAGVANLVNVGSVVLTRAPSGAGPGIVAASGHRPVAESRHRPQQKNTSRPGQRNTRRY